MSRYALLWSCVAVFVAGCAMATGEPESDLGTSREGLRFAVVDVQPTRLEEAHASASNRVFSRNGSCSGTLISPRLVVTAEHCFAHPMSIPTDVRWGVNPNYSSMCGADPDCAFIRACFMSTAYSTSFAVPGGVPGGPAWTCPTIVADHPRRARHDLAILVLDRRVELGRTPAASVIPAGLDFSVLASGSTVRLAAYGQTHLGSVPGTRQARTAVTDGYHGLELFLTFTEGTLRFDSDVFGSGDSGGSILTGGSTSLALNAVISGSIRTDEEFLILNFAGIPIPDFDNAWGAPLSDATNSAWVNAYRTQLVPVPGGAAVWAGDWDFPARGMVGRLASDDTLDPDGDGLRSDPDGAGPLEAHDNCPWAFNPAQADADGDGVGDDLACTTPAGAIISAPCDSPTADLDSDGAMDVCDNCPVEACLAGSGGGFIAICDPWNPGQEDENGDGVGDACEPDTDRDGIPDDRDLCPLEGTPTRRNTNLLAERTFALPEIDDGCDQAPAPWIQSDAYTTRSSPTSPSLGAFRVLGIAAEHETNDQRSWRATSLRFCDCPGSSGANNLEEQERCRTAHGCVVNVDMLTPEPTNRWRPLTQVTHDFPTVGSFEDPILRFRTSPEIGPRPTADFFDFEWDAELEYAGYGLPTEPGPGRRVSAMLWMASSSSALSASERFTLGDRRTDADVDCRRGGAPCPPLDRNPNTRSGYWVGRVLIEPADRSFLPPVHAIRPIPVPDAGLGFCSWCTHFPQPMFSECAPDQLCARFFGDGPAETVAYGAEAVGISDPLLAAALLRDDVDWLASPQEAGGTAARMFAFDPTGRLEDALVLDVEEGKWSQADLLMREIPGFHPDRLGRTVIDAERDVLYQFEGFREGEWTALVDDPDCAACDLAARSGVDGRVGTSSVWRYGLQGGGGRRIPLTDGSGNNPPPPPQLLSRASSSSSALVDVPRDVLAVALHGSRRWALLVDRAFDGTSFVARFHIVDLLSGVSTVLNTRDALPRMEIADTTGVGLHWIANQDFMVVAVTERELRAMRITVGPSTSFSATAHERIAGIRPALNSGYRAAQLATWASTSARGATLLRWRAGELQAVGVGWDELDPCSARALRDFFR